MKTSATLFVLMSGVLPASMHGAAKTEDQPAIVVSVENHDRNPIPIMPVH
jgi:hypothetical protein